MSHSHTTHVTPVDPAKYTLPADAFGSMPRNLILGGLALLGITALGLLGEDKSRPFWSYLFAFFFFMTLTVGCMFVVMIHHVTKAGWSVVIRRVAETVSANMPWMTLLFIPVLIGLALPGLLGDAPGVKHEETAAAHDHSHGHAETAAHGSTALTYLYGWTSASQQAAHGDLYQKKSAYLNLGFFILRAGIYFLILTFLARFFYGRSLKQDKDGDKRHSVAMQRMSGAMFPFWALALTFSAFDWVMTLDYTWFSTIFGAYVFAGCVISGYSLTVLITRRLQSMGHLKEVNSEHFHDAGKMMFAFVVFWAYMAFSQFMLIWYANLPEETGFFWKRWDGGWKPLTILLMLGQFGLPFLAMMSRNIKRNPVTLTVMAVYLLAIHLVDMYWLIMPSREQSFGDVLAGGIWMDVTAVVGIWGIFAGLAIARLKSAPLIPVGDPRLTESMHHVVT